MPNSFTANLGLEKPEVGADANLWGGHLNSDLDILDSIFTSATTRPISTIIKSTTKYVDVTTTSKAMMLAMSSISAGATRTLTVQDTDGTVALIADIATATTGFTTMIAAATIGMVDTSSAQTVSNKNILSATINTSTLATTTTATAAQATTATTLVASVGYADRIGVQQIVATQTGAVATGSNVMPLDDTIPAITEGDEYMTCAITPKSATSKLVIEVLFNFAINNANVVSMALFQDATSAALKAVGQVPPNIGGVSDFPGQMTLRHEMTSGTTSATTFRIRAGTSGGGGTVTFNGAAAARLYGGVMASSIIITEVGI